MSAGFGEHGLEVASHRAFADVVSCRDLLHLVSLSDSKRKSPLAHGQTECLAEYFLARLSLLVPVEQNQHSTKRCTISWRETGCLDNDRTPLGPREGDNRLRRTQGCLADRASNQLLQGGISVLDLRPQPIANQDETSTKI